MCWELYFTLLVYRFFLYILHVFTFTCVCLHIYRSDNFQWHVLPSNYIPPICLTSHITFKLNPFQGHRTTVILHCPHLFCLNQSLSYSTAVLCPFRLFFHSKAGGNRNSDTSVLICQDCMT